MSVRWRMMVPAAAIGGLLVLGTEAAGAQEPRTRNSPNVKMVAHLDPEDGGKISTTDVEIEQELSRPYAYVGRILAPTMGFDIVDLRNPSKARRIYSWRVDNPELHTGLGVMGLKYFKLKGRYYLIAGVQFGPGPDQDVGAVIVDVTGLPDTTKVKEVARIRITEPRGGFHNLFPYKHSDGRVLLFTTASGPFGHIYDLEKVLAGAPDQGFIGRVPWPNAAPVPSIYGQLQGYHDFYVAYHPETNTDRLYGPGFNGYYVYDVTRPETPKLIASVTGAPGLDVAHTVQASPDGRYLVTHTEYPYSPVRIWDIKPALDGAQQAVSYETSVWTPNWKHFTHQSEVRWPYAFVASFKDGLHVMDLRDPANPKSAGHYDTYTGPPEEGLVLRTFEAGPSPFNGAWGVDVRNADGLVVVSDFSSGFWALKMENFNGWNGEKYGVANISSVQNWDEGPRALTP